MEILKKIRKDIADRIVNRIEDSFSLEENQKWMEHKKKLELRMRLTIMQKELRRQLCIFISSALGFVAALFWRDALFQVLKEYLPSSQETLPKITIAIVVSVLAVVGILFVNEILMKRYIDKL